LKSGITFLNPNFQALIETSENWDLFFWIFQWHIPIFAALANEGWEISEQMVRWMSG
jgi:hypothetical protein